MQALRPILLAGLGGFIGSAGRYLIGGWVHRFAPLTTFPIGTLFVNASGCFLNAWNHFEFVHKQPVNLRRLGTNFYNTVVVREYMAWRTHDGKWRKIYGYADGHSQVVEVPDGNFMAWEEQNTYNPEDIKQ